MKINKISFFLIFFKFIFILCATDQLILGHETEPETEFENLIQNYSRNQRAKPPMEKNNFRKHPPTHVEVSFHIVSFSHISVLNMDFTMDMILHQRWQDTRLILSSLQNNETLSIAYMKDKLWIPDLYFHNGKRGNVHTVTTPNYLMWIDKEGNVTFSQKISITLGCPMDLWKFPFDVQYCRILMGSFGYDSNDLLFHWFNNGTNDETNAAITMDTFALNEFDLIYIRPQECDIKNPLFDTLSCISAEVKLRRKFGFYLIYTYIPSLMIIFISWTQFLIDQNSPPARVSLGLLTVVSLMTQTASTVSQLPKVSYIKAIDWWLFVCLAFVVISLMEYALVDSLNRKNKRQRWKQELHKVIKNELDTMGLLHEHQHHQQQQVDAKIINCEELIKKNQSLFTANKNQMKSNVIDKYCLYIIPTCFLIFNIIYWTFYISKME